MKIKDIFGILSIHRRRLLKKETEQTKRLCIAQKYYNELLREEKELNNEIK